MKKIAMWMTSAIASLIFAGSAGAELYGVGPHTAWVNGEHTVTVDESPAVYLITIAGSKPIYLYPASNAVALSKNEYVEGLYTTVIILTVNTNYPNKTIKFEGHGHYIISVGIDRDPAIVYVESGFKAKKRFLNPGKYVSIVTGECVIGGRVLHNGRTIAHNNAVPGGAVVLGFEAYKYGSYEWELYGNGSCVAVISAFYIGK